MAVFICKMCGAALTVPDGSAECFCEYCGTYQTTTLSDNDVQIKKLNNCLKRGQFALEDHDWKKSSTFFEEALDIDPHCAEAYWGLFLTANQLTVAECLNGSFLSRYEEFESEIYNVKIDNAQHIENMINRYTVYNFLGAAAIKDLYQKDFYKFQNYYCSDLGVYEKKLNRLQLKMNKDNNLKRALEFGTPELKADIKQCLDSVVICLNNKIIQIQQEDNKKVSQIQKEYLSYQAEIDKRVVQMNAKALQEREILYQKCVRDEKEYHTILEWKKIQRNLNLLGDYKDSYKINNSIQRKLEKQIKTWERNEKIDGFIKKNWLIALFAFFVVWLIITKLIVPSAKYNDAVSKLESGQYKEAAAEFRALKFFRDSKMLLIEAENALSEEMYKNAVALMDEEKYERAINIFTNLKKYKDSSDKIIECQNGIPARDYRQAESLLANGKFDEAIAAFSALGDYEDSPEKVLECRDEKNYVLAADFISAGDYVGAVKLYHTLGTYKDSSKKLDEAVGILLTNLLEINNAESIIAKMSKMDSEVVNHLVEKAGTEKLVNLLLVVDVKTAAEFLSKVKALKIKEILNSMDSLSAEELRVSFDFGTDFRIQCSEAKPGDILKFGSYEQDNNFENGPEPIEWIVLEKDQNRILVISRTAVESAPYQINERNTIWHTATWKTSSLRLWLNTEFYNQAFRDDERSLIALSYVTAEPNPDGRDDPGNDTEDYIYLLSISEAQRFFSSDEERICSGNAYIESYGDYAVRSGNTCEWWLRTQGFRNSRAVTVLPSGTINETGSDLDPIILYVTVRPVLSIEL